MKNSCSGLIIFSSTLKSLVNQLKADSRVFRSLGCRGNLMCMTSAYVHSTSQGACTFTKTVFSSKTWKPRRGEKCKGQFIYSVPYPHRGSLCSQAQNAHKRKSTHRSCCFKLQAVVYQVWFIYLSLPLLKGIEAVKHLFQKCMHKITELHPKMKTCWVTISTTHLASTVVVGTEVQLSLLI